MWNAGTSPHQLLFIFPRRVNLTTITLHYYSDNTRGLPKLRFFAVPDYFDVWDAPTGSYSRVEIVAVPLSGESAGRRNFSVNVNFTTKRVLLYKYSRSYRFAVSEVEFFEYIGKEAEHNLFLIFTISIIIILFAIVTTEQANTATTVTEAMHTMTSNSGEPGLC